jgi:hypothetical protein
MKIEVSNGEIVDKYTILKIKLNKVDVGSQKHTNILTEYNLLRQVLDSIDLPFNLVNDLYDINLKLWESEDNLRILESKKQFDESFILNARSVYILNDRRYEIKSKINTTTNSTIREEKIIPQY